MKEIIKKTVLGGVGFLANNIATKFLGFAFIIVTSNLLGANEFGVLAICLSITGLIQSVALLGFPTTMQKFFSGDGEKNIENIYGAILIIGVSISISVSIITYTLSPYISDKLFHDNNLLWPLRILSVGIFITVLGSILRSTLQAQVKIKSLIYIDLLRDGGKILLFVLIYNIIPSVISAILSIFLSVIIAFLLSFYFSQKLEIKPAFNSSVIEYKRIFSYTLPITIVGFSYLLSQHTDRLMLGALIDSSAVGIYTIASSFALLMAIFHNSLISVFMPIASETFRNKTYDEMKLAYSFISKWVGLSNGILLIVFIGFGKELLYFVKSDYSTENSYYVLIILGALYFIGTWVGPTGALLQMYEGQKIELINTIIFLILNFTLNLFFIPMFGIIGAAIATFISGVVRNFAQIIEIKIKYNFNIIDKNSIDILVLTICGIVLNYIVIDNQYYKALSILLISILMLIRSIEKNTLYKALITIT